MFAQVDGKPLRKARQLILPTLHASQQEVQNTPATYKVLACGRRWGKSILAMTECVTRALRHAYPVWWIAPTFRNTQAAWNTLTELVQPLSGLPGFKIYRGNYLVQFPNNGFVQVVSGAEPNNLRSAGLGYVVFDECAYGEEFVWTRVLLPSLLDYTGKVDGGGEAMLISTPNRLNWFYDMYTLGLSGENGYKAFHYTTYDNPHMLDADGGTSKIDALAQRMTQLDFRQEILAEFVEDSLNVFRGVREATMRGVERIMPEEGHEYVMGIDWGRAVDYSVICVIDATDRKEVFLDRFNQVGYGLQRARMIEAINLYRPSTVYAEHNAMGDPNIEALAEDSEAAGGYGVPIHAFHMTNPEKKRIVEKMVLAIERGELRLLDNEIANGELMAFEQTTTPSGMIKYSAPSGRHDDTVIARILAHDAVGEQIGSIYAIENF